MILWMNYITKHMWEIYRLYLAWLGEPEGASVNLQQESLVTMGQPAPRLRLESADIYSIESSREFVITFMYIRRGPVSLVK